MILNYDYIEIWEKEKLIKVPNHLNTSIRLIIEAHHEDKDIKENPYNLIMSFRNITKGHVQNPAIKTIQRLTDIFMYTYQQKQTRPMPGRIKVVSPNVFLSELKNREIIAKEFNEEYTEHNISVFTGDTQPKLDMLINMTNFIEKHDLQLLQLPKNKGIRWNLDEWIETSDIERKQSWEQQYD